MADSGIHPIDRATTSPLAASLPQPRLPLERHRIGAQRRAQHDDLVHVLDAETDAGPHGGPSSRVLLAVAALTDDPEERTRLQTEVAVLHIGLARTIAHRYSGRGATDEELHAAASDGMLEAVRTFDGAGHEPFLPHAVTTIKRHLTHQLGLDAPTVPLPTPQPAEPDAVQRLAADIARARASLGLDLGRSPRVSEVARHLGVRVESVVEAVADADHLSDHGF